MFLSTSKGWFLLYFYPIKKYPKYSLYLTFGWECNDTLSSRQCETRSQCVTLAPPSAPLKLSLLHSIMFHIALKKNIDLLLPRNVHLMNEDIWWDEVCWNVTSSIAKGANIVSKHWADKFLCVMEVAAYYRGLGKDIFKCYLQRMFKIHFYCSGLQISNNIVENVVKRSFIKLMRLLHKSPCQRYSL